MVNTEQKWGSGDRGIGEIGSDWENQIFFSILEGFWSDVLDVLGVFIDIFFKNHSYFKVKFLQNNKVIRRSASPHHTYLLSGTHKSLHQSECNPSKKLRVGACGSNH